MDKTSIGFIADVLYIKGIICFEEYEDIQKSSNEEDIGVIVEKMLSEGYNGYVKSRIRGEGYVGLNS